LGCDAFGGEGNGAELSWSPETGTEYYIQVVGDSLANFGSYTLGVYSGDNIAVVLDNNGEYPSSLEGIPTSA
jgi:hypothetical protein